jgi:hypothetical protein
MIKNKDSGASNYLITGTHIDFQKLETQVNYSTYNQEEGTAKDALVILEEIFKSKDITFSKEPNVQQSGISINYVSDCTDDLRDQTDKLLNIASSTGNGIYFVGYDLIKSSFELVSSTDVQKEGAKILLIASGNSSSTNDIYEAIESMEEIDTGYIASSAHKFYDDRTINIYDPINRKWFKKTHNFDQIEKILKRQSLASEVLYSHPQWQKNFPLASNQRQDVDDAEFGFAMRSEMLLARCIKVNIGGNLNCKTGEMIMLTSNNEKMLDKYGGMWLTTMVNHRFGRSDFRTELILTKVYKNKKDFATA